MKLWEYEGKEVKIELYNGHIYIGIAYDYTSALDNTPEIASIAIRHTEIFENDIKEIREIQ